LIDIFFVSILRFIINLEEQIYDVPLRNVWVVEVERVVIDLDTIVEVVVG